MDLKEISSADQAWATDIPEIPRQTGFHYLVAIVDLLFWNVYSFGKGFAYS